MFSRNKNLLLKNNIINRPINYLVSKLEYGNNMKENIYSISNKDIEAFNTKKEEITILGYGPQGRSQALNLKDNGFKVNIGLRKGNSWNKAIEDGWQENKNF